MHQKAPLAEDAAAVGRERSPPRGDRRPLSKRNKSREDRAAAGGADDTYGQIRSKALGARSKTLPAEVFHRRPITARCGGGKPEPLR